MGAAMFSPAMLKAQDQRFQQLANSFKQADYQSVSNVFANTLDVSIDHKEGTYGKSQATALLRDFFSQHRPTDFTIKHTGASQGQSYYAVCEMKLQMNTLQVYILLNSQQQIIQLKIGS